MAKNFDANKKLSPIWDFLKDDTLSDAEKLDRATKLEAEIQSRPIDVWACPNGCHLADHRSRCPRCNTMLTFQGKALLKDVVKAIADKQLEIARQMRKTKAKKKKKK
jgi:hypothetical protein